ncbi:MAG: Undecaprenyl-phosphate mannosyltransferase [Firmicutes bacterium ADurb.Bin456]|nr:MAG: Undecaprenyl-phosphate mannosyltransferase [Firmicutes bacterium ADurb.Bin456]
MTKTLVIIPVYNEEKNIRGVVEGIKANNIVFDLLVVNDGSTDGTAGIVKELGVKLINLPFNLGYGGALQTGYKYAVVKGYDLVIQFDGDGQHNPVDIILLAQKFSAGDTDLVIGSRFLGNAQYRPGAARFIGIKLFSLIIRLATGITVTDPTSGLQAVGRRAFQYYAQMGNFPEDYPDADTLIQMILIGMRVVEVPVVMLPRQAGTSMHAGFKAIFYVVKVFLSIIAVLFRKKIKRMAK